MLYKLFFLLALLFGLSLSAAPITALRPLLRLQLRHSHKISKLSGDPLIQTACRGVGDYESECISTLQSAPPHQKADVNGLAFFTLRFVEDHAVNLTVDIKKFAANPDLAPLLQSALSDCMDQYNPLDDLIEDAINAVLANAYSDAQKFIEAAISDIEVCDSQLKASNLEEKAENKTGEDFQLAKNLKEYNDFLQNILSAALNVLRAN
ncbi:hypothetical protein Pfo_006121 [Paulownia fortunei]|nr:hypothetical protein Pfo_006121 [Paulownia fortunei]